MLIEFHVSNFRSFYEEQTLSLVAGNLTELPENVFEACGPEGFRLLRSAAVYGPNASGKSNLVKAAHFFSDFVRKSSEQHSNEESLRPPPFRLSQKAQKQESTFEVQFLLDGVRYQYGFSLGQQRVREEWLYAFPKSRPQKWFHRERGSADEVDIRFGSSLLGEKQRLREFTRKDTLFLTVAAKWNHAQLTPVSDWITNNLRHIYPHDEFGIRTYTTERLRDDRVFREWAVNLLGAADLGIEGITVRAISPSDVPQFASIPKKLQESISAGDVLVPVFSHRSMSENVETSFAFGDESDGTQRLYDLLGPWWDSLEHGYTLFVDELDASMHPLLIRRLVQSFNDPAINRNGAQLIFTTHDTSLLTETVLRRDQVWFTEKSADGSTRLYSLHDYRPRKGEALERGYLSGRYGAIPDLSELELQS